MSTIIKADQTETSDLEYVLALFEAGLDRAKIEYAAEINCKGRTYRCSFARDRYLKLTIERAQFIHSQRQESLQIAC